MKSRSDLAWAGLVFLFLILLYAVMFAVEIRSKPVFFWIANW